MRGGYDYEESYEDTAPEEVAPTALATPSDDQILAFVQANIDNPALIAETAAQYGVSVADLSRVTGYGEDAVTSYFDQHDVAPPAYTPPPVEISKPEPPRPPDEPIYEPPPPPPEEPVYEPPKPEEKPIYEPKIVDLGDGTFRTPGGNLIDSLGSPVTKAVDTKTTTTATTADTTPVGALTTVQNNTATNQAASTTPVGGLTQAAPANAVDSVTQQILGQGLTSKWKGEGKGSAEANAADMANILTSIGITDIKDFGKITKTVDAAVQPVYAQGDLVADSEGQSYYQQKIVGYIDQNGNPVDPNLVKTETVYGGESGSDSTAYIAPVGKQEVFGNKKTGQEVPVTYGERQQGDAFGGTFDGDGNTGYRVKFAPDGTPIFYTTKASSNDLQILMDDLGPLGQIALAFATGGLSIPEQIAAKFAISVLSGQDIGDAVKSAATSYAGSLVPGLDIIKDGASYLTDLDSTGILSKAFTGAAVAGTKAVLSGQDLGDAVLAGAASGGASGATTALLGNIEGFDDLSKTQQTTIRNLVTGTLTGKPITTTLLNSVIDTATSEVGKAIDSTVTGLTDDNTLNSSTINKVTSTLNVDGTGGGTGTGTDDDGDDGGDDDVTTTTTGGTEKSSLAGNATVGAVTSVLKSTLANTAKTATKGAITSAVTGKKMAARPSVAKQLTGSALSALQRAVPTKVDISKLIPTTAKKAPPKKVDVAQLKAMTPVSGLSAIKKG